MMHIVAKGTIDLLAHNTNENDKAQKTVAFKINAPFRSCISKINNTLIENEEDIDIVKVSLTGSVWNFYRDEIDDVNDKIVEQSPERPQSFSNLPFATSETMRDYY